MTDLTEKWKKGELPEGEYWCKITESPCVEQIYLPCYYDDTVIKVLAPVPSYDEWKEKNETAYILAKGITERNEKIEQLKELLRECRDEIEYLRKHYKGKIDYFKNNTRLNKEISQALGEDK